MEDRGHLVKQAGKIFLCAKILAYYGFSVGDRHHKRLQHRWISSTRRVQATNLLQWRVALPGVTIFGSG